MLTAHTNFANPAWQSSLGALSHRFGQAGTAQPKLEAYGVLNNALQHQSAALAYIDTFWLLGIATGIMFLLSFLLRKNNPRSRGKAPIAAH